MDLGYSISRYLIRKEYKVEVTAIDWGEKNVWKLKYPSDEILRKNVMNSQKEMKIFLNKFLNLPFDEIARVWFHASKPNSFLTFEVRKKKGLDCVRLYEYENCEDVLKFIEERYWVEETF